MHICDVIIAKLRSSSFFKHDVMMLQYFVYKPQGEELVSSRKAQKQSLLRQNQFAVKCKSNYIYSLRTKTVPRNPALKNLFKPSIVTALCSFLKLILCGTFRFFLHESWPCTRDSVSKGTDLCYVCFAHTETVWGKVKCKLS